MKDEHDDDMSAEVGEGVQGEADQYAVVAEDDEARTAEAESDRLTERRRDAATADADDEEE